MPSEVIGVASSGVNGSLLHSQCALSLHFQDRRSALARSEAVTRRLPVCSEASDAEDGLRCSFSTVHRRSLLYDKLDEVDELVPEVPVTMAAHAQHRACFKSRPSTWKFRASGSSEGCPFQCMYQVVGEWESPEMGDDRERIWVLTRRTDLVQGSDRCRIISVIPRHQ